MAYSYAWPGTLPQNPQDSYSETGGVLLLNTPMDAGPAKLRKRGNKPSVMSVNFNMTTAQVNTFELFVKDTLKGTARFGFTHPRTGSVVEVRIVPQGNGELYNIGYINNVYWSVSFQLEVLP